MQGALSNNDFGVHQVIGSLSYDARWLSLLHTRQQGVLKQHYHTSISDERFFLTGQEDFDPKAELTATIAVFIEQPESQCRFTGRFFWLQEVAPELVKTFPKVICKEYEKWLEAIDASQVVLVLAASYLNSPSSMYGHTLLRVDSGQKNRNTPFLSQAINFSAKVSLEDNGLLYSFKGLSGGYPGFFSMMPYHKKLKEYSRLENRDIWEYTLNLNRQEMHRMLSHVWEVKQISFDYFFFDENCSFRLLELLDVARPNTGITQNFEWYAIPVDTIRAVSDKDFVKSTFMRPSAQRKLTAKLDRLTDNEQSQVIDVVVDKGDLDILRNNPPERVGSLAVAASEYWRYEYGKLHRGDKNIKKQFELLRVVNQYSDPASDNDEEVIFSDLSVRPDFGHETELLATTAGVFEDEFYTQLEWRISYHDLLDVGRGYPDGVSLTLGGAQLRLEEDGDVLLQRFDLVEIVSLAPRNPFFKSISWRVQAGLERVFEPDYPLVTHLNGGGGITKEIGLGISFYTFLNARVEYSSAQKNDFDAALGVSAGLLSNNARGKWMLSVEQWQFAGGSERYASRLAYNLPLTVNHALRFEWKHGWFESLKYDDASISYRYYF